MDQKALRVSLEVTQHQKCYSKPLFAVFLGDTRAIFEPALCLGPQSRPKGARAVFRVLTAALLAVFLTAVLAGCGSFAADGDNPLPPGSSHPFPGEGDPGYGENGEEAPSADELRGRFQPFGIFQPEVDPDDIGDEGFGSGLQMRVEGASVVYEGSGHGLIELPAELAYCEVSASYGGDDLFLIRSVDLFFNVLGFVVFEVGPYEGVSNTRTATGTPCYLEIEAAGNWTVRLSPIAD